MLADTHVHLQHEKYADDLEAVLGRAREAGVNGMVVAAYDLDASRQAVRLAERIEGVFAAVGVHPHSAAAVNRDIMDELEDLAGSPVVVAVGETGLDYHYMHSSREMQKAAFRQHLELAGKLKKPVIIHDREAHEDTWEILRDYLVGEPGGVWHCFSGDSILAGRIMDAGWYLGIGGIVTFSRELAELVAGLPLEKILLETDAPYLAPAPYRGRRNEPAWTRIIARKVAELKGCDLDAVAEITTSNALKLFKLPL